MANFKEIRRQGIGGTDIAAILGIHPYKSAYEVYLEKVEGVETDLSANEAVITGTLLEDEIANKYEDSTGEKLFCTDTLKLKSHPYIIGNPDRLAIDSQKIIEIKTTNDRLVNSTGKVISDEMMEVYTLQASHYMLVSGLKNSELVISVIPEKIRREMYCILGSHVIDKKPLDFKGLLDDCVMHRYTIPYDKEIEEIIISAATNFWKEHVEKKVPPPIDYKHPNAKDCVKIKYNKVYEDSVQLDGEYVELKNNYLSYRNEIKMLQKKSEEAQARILDAMQNHGIGRFSDGSTCIRRIIKAKDYGKEYIRVDFKEAKGDF